MTSRSFGGRSVGGRWLTCWRLSRVLKAGQRYMGTGRVTRGRSRVCLPRNPQSTEATAGQRPFDWCMAGYLRSSPGSSRTRVFRVEVGLWLHAQRQLRLNSLATTARAGWVHGATRLTSRSKFPEAPKSREAKLVHRSRRPEELLAQRQSPNEPSPTDAANWLLPALPKPPGS